MTKLEQREGNGKIILLNTKNLRWVRLKKEKFEDYCQNENKLKAFENFVEQKFGLFSGEMVLPRKSVYFAITGRCNLQCEFCTMNAGPFVNTKQDMSIDEIQNVVIPKLQEISPGKIVITGGEPFMREDIDEILEMFAQKFQIQRITLQSNGWTLCPNKVKWLSDKIGVLEISIEHIFEDQCLLEKMERVFEAVLPTQIMLSLSFVVDQKSEKYLEQAIEICQKYNASLTIRVVALVGRAKVNNAKDKMLQGENILKMQLRVVRYLLEKEYFDDGLVRNYFGELHPRRHCGAYGNILSIHPDGTIFLCGNFKNKEFSIGNIRIESTAELYANLAKKIESAKMEQKFCVDKIEECKGCWAQYFCSGPCAAETEENGGIPQNFMNKCFAIRALLHYSMFYYDIKLNRKENMLKLEEYLEDILEGRKTV